LGFVLGSSLMNREGSEFIGSPASDFDQLPSQMVKTAAQVVNGIPSDDGELGGQLLPELDTKNKFSGLRVAIAQEAIWVALSKDLHARYKIVDVVFGPVNLRPDANKSLVSGRHSHVPV